MKTLISGFLLMFSISAIAQTLYWEETILTEGCAQSERAAKQKARHYAESAAREYKEICDGDAGDFAVRYQDGYCAPYDPTNFSCPARCNMLAIMTCHEPGSQI